MDMHIASRIQLTITERCIYIFSVITDIAFTLLDVFTVMEMFALAQSLNLALCYKFLVY